jgi:hypothetical protein
MYSHGSHPHNGSIQRKSDQEPANIIMGNSQVFANTEIGKHPYQSQRDPEGTIGYKGTVTEIIAALELLKTCNELGGTAQGHGGTEDNSRAAPTQVMKLEQQRGHTETRQTDYRWITLSWS